MGAWAKVKWAFGWPSRLLRLLIRPVDVLVVGSAHIDTTGEVEDTYAFTKGSDHDGRIIYSIGGGGYNVAVNLAAAGKNRRVALDTLLPKESRLADLVMTKLVSNGVSLDYVRRLSMRNESVQGFVRAVMGGRVEIRDRETRIFSVSRTLVNTPEFWARNRDKIAVERAKALVVDSSLLEAAARDVIQRAIEKRTPLFVFVTTDSSAQRFARRIVRGTFSAEGGVLCLAGSAGVMEAMVLEIDQDDDRHAERIRVLRGQSKSIDPRVASDICGLLKSRYVASIYDLKATILAWTGDHLQIDMSDLQVTNQKGAGDALMAGIVDVFLSQGGKSVGSVGAQEVLDLRRPQVTSALSAEIRHHTGRAVSSYGATLGSVISFEEPFETWGRLLERQLKYSAMQAINAFTWLVIVIGIDRLALLIVGEPILRLPFKKGLSLIGKLLKPLLAWLLGY